MGEPKGGTRITVAQARATEVDPNRGSALMMAHGSMTLRHYAPRGHDPQKPHEQDEIYVVIRGEGTFMRNEERMPFAPGDVLFVGAGETHRFEDFSDDFETWVVFYGPKGGE